MDARAAAKHSAVWLASAGGSVLRSHGDRDRLTHADLFAALEQATGQLGRKVAPTIYSPKELAKRVKQENAFVTRVLAQPKLWLIGDERALAACRAPSRIA